jgi:AcrR family transcriptional regulator
LGSQSRTSADRKAALLLAARRLFIDHGFHGTSMRRLAAEADIALGGIYNHFDSKEAIFATVFFENHPYQVVLPALLEAQGDHAEQLLRDAAQRLIHSLQIDPDFLKLLFIELVEFEGRHLPELLRRIYPRVQHILLRLTRGPDRLRPIAPPVLIRAFFGFFLSYTMTEMIIARLPDEFRALQTHALEDFTDIFLYGVLAGSSPEEGLP